MDVESLFIIHFYSYSFFGFFCCFFHRSNSALHPRSSIEILLDHWATFCRGASQCPFFVSGSNRIRTHALVVTMRTCYRCSTLTPSYKQHSLFLFMVFGVPSWRRGPDPQRPLDSALETRQFSIKRGMHYQSHKGGDPGYDPPKQSL